MSVRLSAQVAADLSATSTVPLGSYLHLQRRQRAHRHLTLPFPGVPPVRPSDLSGQHPKPPESHQVLGRTFLSYGLLPAAVPQVALAS